MKTDPQMEQIQTLSRRWMIMGTSLASMTACTCCWLPAVMLDKNHTASCRTTKTPTIFMHKNEKWMDNCPGFKKVTTLKCICGIDEQGVQVCLWTTSSQREPVLNSHLFLFVLMTVFKLDQNPEVSSERLDLWSRPSAVWVGPGRFVGL